MDYEDGKAALDNLIAWAEDNASANRNEASTRFHLIDTLLLDVLGWPKEEIGVEVREARTISDYELGFPARRLLLEAKREGVVFELPAGFEASTLSLHTLKELSSGIGEAVEQALGYALGRGIPLAVVANGDQWIAFLASRTDGVSPRDGRAVVFPSLVDMRQRFKDFWNGFSQYGVASRRLVSQLQSGSLPTPPEKLSARLPSFPGYKNRNPVAAELQILGGLFLEDIARQPEIEEEFLRECYYPAGALPQYATVARSILEARYSLFFEKEASATMMPATTKKGIAPELWADIAAAALSERPIILLGDVGVGKTIFVRHLIKIDAADALKKAVVLYVDFGREPALADDLRRYVQAEFVRQLRENFGVDVYSDAFVRNVYQGEVGRFGKGVARALAETDPSAYKLKEVEFLQSLVSDLDTHLRASLQVLQKGQQRQTVIFLDNIDQRGREFQEEVFLMAQSFAATWPCTCFISLRPETFYRSKNEGSITGYQPRVFTIAPPRVDRVIERRLAFGRKQLRETGRLSTFPVGVTVGPTRLDSYMAVLEQAFSRNEAIIEFVESMSGGNVRRALDYLVSFVGSGHVDARKIFDILDRTDRYDLPVHEFVRAVTYGDHVYYDPSDSPVGNVFDILIPDGREHFLVSILLRFAERAGMAGHSQGDEGFVPVDSFFGVGQDLGFQPSQIDFSIRRARARRMLEAYPRFPQEEWGVDPAPPTHLRITSVGGYVVNRLIPTLTYVDAMITDTPIVEPAFAERIGEAASILERIERARTFREYLDSQWPLLAAEDVPYQWPVESAKLEAAMTKAEEGAQRALRD